MLGTFLLLTVCGVWAALQLAPKYTAEAVVLLNPRPNQMLEGSTNSSIAQLDIASVNSEVSLFYLPNLALDIISRLRLKEDPSYAQEVTAPLLAWLPDVVRSRFATMTGTSSPAPNLGPTSPNPRLLKQFLGRLEVVNDNRTYTIRVRYTARDPEQASQVANALADAQISGQREARAQSMREAGAWLKDEIGALQERVTRAETAEQDFRRENGLGDDRTVSVAQQEVSALAQQVTLAGAEVSRAQARLRETRAGLVTSLEEEMRVASEREVNLRRQLELARKRLDQVQIAEGELRPLAREAAASRVLLEDFMRRARSADAQVSAPRPDSRVVSRALVPTEPSGWTIGRLVPVIVTGAAMVSFLLAALVTLLVQGLRSAAQTERLFSFDVVGELPAVKGGWKSIRRVILEEPTSVLTESIRSVASNLIGHTEKPFIVQVTSPAAGDGKSVLAASLAHVIAASGRRCLLVDANLRSPSTHSLLGIPQQAGLFELLCGTKNLDEVVVEILPRLSVVTAGHASGDPLALFSPSRVGHLCAFMRSEFDVVVIDSPPVLPVCDSLLVAPYVDQLVLALRWNVTSFFSAQRTLELVRRKTARPPVFVLTQMERARMSRYEEGGYNVTGHSSDGRAWSEVEARRAEIQSQNGASAVKSFSIGV